MHVCLCVFQPVCLSLGLAMQFWHARAGMRVRLKPCTGRFAWAALPCSFRVVWPLLFPALPRTIQGDRDDCCTKAILSQIALFVFISLLSVWREINSAAMLDFLHFLCLPLILRRTWTRLALRGCRGGEEKDLSKTLSAVSSKTRAAVHWLLTRLLISTLCSPKTTAVGGKPVGFYVHR